jgi:quinol-cytochrome oxidoreductase complex cytochrome b subunit
LHIHPVKVRRHALRFSYTLGLGGACALMFLILTVTGIFLMLYYTPYPEPAYRSMKDLEFAVSFGQVLRNMHRWSAHAMVVLVFLHMTRVFFTGSYKAPRQFNWVVGVGLLVLTLLLSFTGYLLPWDQLAFWAITVGSNIATYAPVVGDWIRYLLLGGDTVGEAALLRFYVLHCFILPALTVLLMGVHFWRIRKDGGISGPEVPPPAAPNSETVPAPRSYALMALARGEAYSAPKLPEDTEFVWPHLIYRELIWALLLMVGLLALSLAVNAPLEEMADPTNTPNPAKAPWYFLGLQELVHYSAFVGGVAVPALLVVGLAAVPYIDRNPEVSLAMIALTVIGTLFRGPNWDWVVPW